MNYLPLAYARLADAEQIVCLLVCDLPKHTQTVTVSVAELETIQRHIMQARDIIRTHSLEGGSNV